MQPKDALNLLDRATATIQANRETHMGLAQAVQTVRAALDSITEAHKPSASVQKNVKIPAQVAKTEATAAN